MFRPFIRGVRRVCCLTKNSLPGRPAAPETAAAAVEGATLLRDLRVRSADSSSTRGGGRSRTGTLLCPCGHHHPASTNDRVPYGAVGKKRRRRRRRRPWAPKYAPLSREAQALAWRGERRCTQACPSDFTVGDPPTPPHFSGRRGIHCSRQRHPKRVSAKFSHKNSAHPPCDLISRAPVRMLCRAVVCNPNVVSSTAPNSGHRRIWPNRKLSLRKLVVRRWVIPWWVCPMFWSGVF